jgi:hypothetical protein
MSSTRLHVTIANVERPMPPHIRGIQLPRGTRRALLIAATSVILASCQSFVSKGTMPLPGPNGQVDASSAPDFIAVAGPGSAIAGYARREDVLDPHDQPFPVYGEDLTVVVGQMVPEKGFVPVGVDPNSVPDIPVVVGPVEQNPPPDRSKVTMYVRNDSSTEIETAVLVAGNFTEGGGFLRQNLGVGCFSMPAGSQLVLLDRAPTDPGASVVRVLYTRDSKPEGTSLWIAVSSDGTISQGVGVPAWWGPAQAC